jgi:hypothetical protein
MKAPTKKAVATSQVGGTGGADSDDDPMGRVPIHLTKNEPKFKEVSIKGNQFETETHEISTSYDPPS